MNYELAKLALEVELSTGRRSELEIVLPFIFRTDVSLLDMTYQAVGNVFWKCTRANKTRGKIPLERSAKRPVISPQLECGEPFYCVLLCNHVIGDKIPYTVQKISDPIGYL